MTIQNLIEGAQRSFPKARHAELIKDIDVVQKRFSRETLLLEKEGSLASPSTTLSWDLPSDFIELADKDSIQLYNSDGDPLYLGQLEIEAVIDNGHITFYSTTTTTIDNMPSSVDSAYIRYRYVAPDVDEYTDTLTIDESFHEGIEAGVMERLYARYPTIPLLNEPGAAGQIFRHDTNMISYWKGVYTENRINAKKYRNSKRNTFTEFSNYPFAGRFELIKRGYVSSTTTIFPTTLGYSKYVKVTVTSPSTVTIGNNWGWTTTPTGSVTGSTLTLASADSEFTETMVVKNANYSRRHARTDATAWTFDLPSSFTTYSFELVELS
jgi:hypothetical protein